MAATEAFVLYISSVSKMTSLYSCLPIIVDMGGAVRGGSMAQSQALGVGQIRTTFDWAPAAASPTHASNSFLKGTVQ